MGAKNFSMPDSLCYDKEVVELRRYVWCYARYVKLALGSPTVHAPAKVSIALVRYRAPEMRRVESVLVAAWAVGISYRRFDIAVLPTT